MSKRSQRTCSQSGFSIIELMVAIVIGMVAILIMTQAMSVAEGYRRTTASGGESQMGGALAMFLMQRDLRNVGYGLLASENSGAGTPITPLSLCANNPTRAYLSGKTVSLNGPSGLVNGAATPTPRFVHFAVNPPGIAPADSGDVIQVIYAGTTASVSAPRKGLEAVPSTTAGYSNTFTADNPLLRLDEGRFGYAKGDVILIAGVPELKDGAANSASFCQLAEVTGLPGAGGSEPVGFINDLLIEASVSSNTSHTYCSSYAATCPNPPDLAPKFNKAGGLGLQWDRSLSQRTRIYNLGPRPDVLARLVARFFAVRGNRLTYCDMLISDCLDATKVTDTSVWIPIVDDVVSLRAAYGIDTTATQDGIVDIFTQSDPADGDWSRVVSVHMSLISRSKQQVGRQGETGGNKKITLTVPLWAGDADSTSHDGRWAADYKHVLSGDPDWQYYRYRSFETVVPFRNLIWK